MPQDLRDRAVEGFARRQAGAISHVQCAAAGLSDTMISDRVGAGRWVRLAPGVYALASHPGTFERQCWAAVLSEPCAAIAGFAAAALHDFVTFRPGGVEIAVPPDGNARNPLARVHRYADAPVTHLRGLPVTTLAQTAFDLASRVSCGRMERVLDALLLGRRLSLADLEERLAAFEGTRRRGLPLMRAMIDDRRADGWFPNESELEHRLDPLLRALPGDGRVERQSPFSWRDAAPGRVDRWLPGYQLIVEADGRRWHGRIHDFDQDRWRDNVAAAHGVRVMRFTWTHLTQRPTEARRLIIDAGRAGRAPA